MISGGAVDGLASAITDSDDPQTVRDATPAYLLMIDALARSEPDDEDVLLAAARLNSAYAGLFVDQPQRARRMADKALAYAETALCLEYEDLCAVKAGRPDQFKAALAELDEDDLELLHGYGTVWAGWLQQNSDDWSALAELPKMEALFDRVITLEEDFARGEPHLYLGVLRSQIPPSLGGDPEKGRFHFEQAVRYSRGHNLMAKVELARNYCRLTFDRPLHDRLLREVLAADPHSPGLTLANIIAQREARTLLADSLDYFGEE